MATSVCVFCGSSPGRSAAFGATARELGELLAARGVRLVYGGGRVGLMGEVADATLRAGGEVVGVIPQHLVDAEVAHTGLTRLEVTASMHARKARMAELSDGVIALPGGLGTFEEVFEILTWDQLGLVALPVVFCDVEGFFAPLLEFLDRAVELGFLRVEHRALARRAATATEALDRVGEPLPSGAVPKWLDRS